MTRFVHLAAGRAAYEVQGEGVPVVLLHGAEATRESFAKVAGVLQRAACVVTYDQRACGESEGGTPDPTILDLAQDAAELMDALGFAHYAVVGTSLGGRIAQALAHAQPARVQALVLCNTWPLDTALADIDPEATRELRALRAALPATARELAERFYTPAHVALHPTLVERFMRPPVNSRRALLAAQVHPLAAEDIAVPTLCLSGTQDGVVPPQAMAQLARRIPHAVLEHLEGVGHSAAVQAPGLLADHIARFVQRTSSPTERLKP